MQYSVPEDKWFEIKGVRPPERIPHMTEEEREQLMEKARTNHHCQWQQRGPEIFCNSGENRHGKRIGTHQRLTGQTVAGLPILKPFDIT